MAINWQTFPPADRALIFFVNLDAAIATVIVRDENI